MSLTFTYQNDTSCVFDYSIIPINMDPNLSIALEHSKSVNFYNGFRNENNQNTKQMNCGYIMPNTIYKLYKEKFDENPQLEQHYSSSIYKNINVIGYRTSLQKLDKDIIKKNWLNTTNINMEFNSFSINQFIQNKNYSPWFDINNEVDYTPIRTLQLTESCLIFNRFFNATRYDGESLEHQNKIAKTLELRMIPFGTDCVYYVHYFDNVILNSDSYEPFINTLHIANVDYEYIKSNVKFWYNPYPENKEFIIPIKIMNWYTMLKNIIKKVSNDD